MEAEGTRTQEVLEKLHTVYEDLRRHKSYDGWRDTVEDVVEQTRSLLSGNGDIGPWEREQLEYARSAIEANFLMLAIFSAIKAIEVHRLPQDEYEHGYYYGNRR